MNFLLIVFLILFFVAICIGIRDVFNFAIKYYHLDNEWQRNLLMIIMMFSFPFSSALYSIVGFIKIVRLIVYSIGGKRKNFLFNMDREKIWRVFVVWSVIGVILCLLLPHKYVQGTIFSFILLFPICVLVLSPFILLIGIYILAIYDFACDLVSKFIVDMALIVFLLVVFLSKI